MVESCDIPRITCRGDLLADALPRLKLGGGFVSTGDYPRAIVVPCMRKKECLFYCTLKA